MPFLAAAVEGVTPIITSAQASTIIDTITANSGVLLPVGLAVLGLICSIKIIPRIVHIFI